MKKDLQINTVKCVGVSQIIPEDWADWIWCPLSEDAPFSWGGNNHSLVDAVSFRDHMENVLSYQDDEDLKDLIQEHLPAVLDIISYLEAGHVYIDLEK